MLIDSHCHLDRLNLSKNNNSLQELIDETFASGVERMLCVCISENNKDDVLEIAQSNNKIFASVGVHPSDVSADVVSITQLKQWATSDKVIALGESGLDYYYGKDNKAKQKESFVNHLVAAGDLELPVIVHTRDAREDTISLIEQYGNKKSAGVLHCFTESWEMAQAAIEMNYYISISGIVTFKNAGELRDVVKNIPLDRLLVETDSPYLAPVPYRGKPNQPKYVKEVAQYIAELKEVSYDTLLKETSCNFFKLFTRAF